MPGGSCHLRLLRGDDLRDGGLDVRARLEEDLDDRDAGERRRLDVLDIAHRGGEPALVLGRDALPHLLRGEAVVVPDDADDRDVDLGKDVRRHARQRERGGEDDEHRHHDERVGATQRDLDERHGRRATEKA